MSNWWVPLIFIILNVIFAVGGYLLGKKTQQNHESLEWVKRNKELKLLELAAQKRIEVQLKELEMKKLKFDQASWNEKIKMLGSKK